MIRLNLGSSDDLKPGYLNVDTIPQDYADAHFHGSQYQQADLNQPWPWEDSSVDEIYAWDVFEHLSQDRDDHVRRHPHWQPVAPKIWVMNEAHRVLKPGGLLDLAVPCVMLSDGRVNPGAFADPTHGAPRQKCCCSARGWPVSSPRCATGLSIPR